jgi:peptidoglycan/LPS O-acetylase OafA/YrhL
MTATKAQGGPRRAHSLLFGKQLRTSTGAVRVNALDGARGFFVSLVLLYHFGVTALVGGWVGINHFFVFSAYLIGRLLGSERVRTGKVDIAQFYLRRVRRIIPAVLVLLTAVTIYGFAFADPYRKRDIGGDVVATLGFVQNWHLIARDDFYFEQVGNPSLLRHMWTLAVEEQFYILVPILVIALFAFGAKRSTRVAVAAALAVGAAAWGAYVASGTNLTFARLYYGTDTRAAALFVGVALAFLMGRGLDGKLPVVGNRTVMAVLGCAGFVATLVPFFVVDQTSTWLFSSGGILLLALAAGALLIMLADPRPMPLKRFFSWMPFVHLGRMTLGLYLYHWPIHVWTRGLLDGLPLVVSVLIQAALTVLVATISFRFLEVPIVMHGLRGILPKLGKPLIAGAAVVAASLVAGVALARAPLPGDGTIPALVAGQPAYIPGTHPVKATLVGDSVAVSLADGWKGERYPDITLRNAARIGCDLVTDRAVGDNGLLPEEPQCKTFGADWVAAARDQGADTLVVLAGMQMMIGHQIFDRRVQPNTAEGRTLIFDTLDRIEKSAREVGVRTIQVVGMPCRQIDPLRLDPRLRFFAKPGSDPANIAWLNGVLRDWAAGAADRRAFLDLWQPLCAKAGFDPVVHGVQLYHDTVHFSPEGAAMVWTWLAPQIREHSTP